MDKETGNKLLEGRDYILYKESGTTLPVIKLLNPDIFNKQLTYKAGIKFNQDIDRFANGELDQEGLGYLQNELERAFGSSENVKIVDQVNNLLSGNKLESFSALVRSCSVYSYDPDFRYFWGKGLRRFSGFIDNNTGLFNFQCDGANLLLTEILNLYFESAKLPYKARARSSYYNTGSGVLSAAQLHKYTEIVDLGSGEVIKTLDATPAGGMIEILDEKNISNLIESQRYVGREVLSNEGICKSINTKAEGGYSLLKRSVENKYRLPTDPTDPLIRLLRILFRLRNGNLGHISDKECLATLSDLETIQTLLKMLKKKNLGKNNYLKDNSLVFQIETIIGSIVSDFNILLKLRLEA